MFRQNRQSWKISLIAAASVTFVAGCGQQGAGPVAEKPDATPVAANDVADAEMTCTLSIETMT